MEDGSNEKWDSDRLASWIQKLIMPTSSKKPSRPQTVGSRGSQNYLQLPDGEISFIALNKTRPRATRPKQNDVDKLSLFLERVAGEAGPDNQERIKKNRRKACEILHEVLQMAFALDPKFMRVFEMPSISLIEDERTLETLSHSEFNSRLFLKKFEHPDAIQTVSGVQDDIPPGVALCRISDRITPPEQIRTRNKMSLVMDDLGYISPSRIFPWFAQGIATAAKIVQQKRCNIFHNEEAEQLLVELEFPQVALHISTGSGSIEPLVVNLFAAIRGTGWPRGALLQHGLPKQRRFSESGQQCMGDIGERIDDGQTLWYLEARPLQLDPSLQKKARFRGGLRRIMGGVDRLWMLSLTPARRLILDHVVATCAHQTHNFRVLDVRHVVLAIAEERRWRCVTPPLVDTLVLWSVKRSLAETRSLGRCFIEVIRLLLRTLHQGSCPDFLLPNVNAVGHIPREEAAEVAASLEQLIADVQEKPGELLHYVGYRNSLLPQTSKRKSAASRRSGTQSRHSSRCTIYSIESKTKDI